MSVLDAAEQLVDVERFREVLGKAFAVRAIYIRDAPETSQREAGTFAICGIWRNSWRS